jgi:hypothetical protein
MNKETLEWFTLAQAEPPMRVKLFLRLQLKSGVIDFETGLWNGQNFTPKYLNDVVTHWAASQAANKSWFVYSWNAKPSEGRPPAAGQIL